MASSKTYWYMVLTMNPLLSAVKEPNNSHPFQRCYCGMGLADGV